LLYQNKQQRAMTAYNESEYKLATLQDLTDFKNEIILEVKKTIKEHAGQPLKKWLKTKEVQGILGVSITTLLTLRNNGHLPFTKMGGVLYYDYDDILKVMDPKKER
jgi:L-cysteine desulfidase